jgi:hypothetical protein
MFVLGAQLVIVPKDRTGGLYQATVFNSRDLTFRRTGQLGLALVTDAEASPDEKSVVVRTGGEVAIYGASALLNGGSKPNFRMSLGWLSEPQGEGVALNGDTLFLSSEGGAGKRPGSFVRLRCSEVAPSLGGKSSSLR